MENRALVLQKKELEERLEKNTSIENIIGNSSAIRKIFEEIKKVAPTKATVLITGESGVGKELVANAIHNFSQRKSKPFIKVHCAALAETLLESELFGHEKGAFTGAIERKRGRFELSNKGSIFLDEIGEINQNIQIKLLRVLQEKQIERVGSSEPIDVDTRVIAATNKNLEKEMKEGRFREDLYYRLNVVHIFIPPLRERREDIPLLVDSFVKEFSNENGKEISSIEAKARSAIYNYDWPGNIRQLRNCIESAVVMTSDNILHFEDLPFKEKTENELIKIPVGSTMKEAEREIIVTTLNHENNNKKRVSDILGIGRKTLYRKLKEYNIEDI